jgi:hypothetical protein
MWTSPPPQAWQQLSRGMAGRLLFPAEDRWTAATGSCSNTQPPPIRSQSVASPRTASEWLGQVRELLYEHGTGRAYQNFANPELADPLYAYYGEHLPRLRNVKARYDPDDFFHHEQSIPPIHEE